MMIIARARVVVVVGVCGVCGDVVVVVELNQTKPKLRMASAVSRGAVTEVNE
jgi:hypothetical protein